MNKTDILLRAIPLLLSVLFFSSAYGQEKKTITYSAEESIFQKKEKTDVIKLYRNVRFEHEGAIMRCDSAYYYRKENSFEAFSNVKVNQADTITMFCDKLFYNGTTKVLDAKGNVRFNDNKMKLTTPEITYNRETGSASYFKGGNIKDPENKLFSKIGFTKTKVRVHPCFI